MLAATKVAEPIKWIEDRRENLLAAGKSRREQAEAAFAFAEDGTILAGRIEHLQDAGAYPTPAPVGRAHFSRIRDSMASSSASSSLLPPRAKNLIPLSGIGLWLADSMTPRSASQWPVKKATPGVGTTPSRTSSRNISRPIPARETERGYAADPLRERPRLGLADGRVQA